MHKHVGPEALDWSGSSEAPRAPPATWPASPEGLRSKAVWEVSPRGPRSPVSTHEGETLAVHRAPLLCRALLGAVRPTSSGPDRASLGPRCTNCLFLNKDLSEEEQKENGGGGGSEGGWEHVNL